MKKIICFGKVVNGVMITLRENGERFLVEAEGHGYYVCNGLLYTLEEAREFFNKQVENVKDR